MKMTEKQHLTNQGSFAPDGRYGLTANGFLGVLACFQGISGVQVPLRLHLTTSNAPVRYGAITVQTTSALATR
jgi:hypothetical protein